jgi:hypothetical protein
MDNGRLATLTNMSNYFGRRGTRKREKEAMGGQAASLLFPKSSKSEKEGAMTDYTTLVVVFLMLPVLMQIFLPLLMLAGYGLIQMIKMVIWRPPAVDGAADLEKVAGEAIYPRSM